MSKTSLRTIDFSSGGLFFSSLYSPSWFIRETRVSRWGCGCEQAGRLVYLFIILQVWKRKLTRQVNTYLHNDSDIDVCVVTHCWSLRTWGCFFQAVGEGKWNEWQITKHDHLAVIQVHQLNTVKKEKYSHLKQNVKIFKNTVIDPQSTLTPL